MAKKKERADVITCPVEEGERVVAFQLVLTCPPDPCTGSAIAAFFGNWGKARPTPAELDAGAEDEPLDPSPERVAQVASAYAGFPLILDTWSVVKGNVQFCFARPRPGEVLPSDVALAEAELDAEWNATLLKLKAARDRHPADCVLIFRTGSKGQYEAYGDDAARVEPLVIGFHPSDFDGVRYGYFYGPQDPAELRHTLVDSLLKEGLSVAVCDPLDAITTGSQLYEPEPSAPAPDLPPPAAIVGATPRPDHTAAAPPAHDDESAYSLQRIAQAQKEVDRWRKEVAEHQADLSEAKGELKAAEEKLDQVIRAVSTPLPLFDRLRED